MIKVFSDKNFAGLCDKLAKKDNDLKRIILQYGYPPLWSRTPSFATLVYIILEQQVSLASAKAAYTQLEKKLGDITPKKLLLLSDEELKACYFSRQKIKYVKHLSASIIDGSLSMDEILSLPDMEVTAQLKKIKGIGDWTADIFLMMCLHRIDRFPLGDIALIKSIQEVKSLPGDTSKEAILKIAAVWKPYRTIAAYLLWHAYLRKRNR